LETRAWEKTSSSPESRLVESLQLLNLHRPNESAGYDDALGSPLAAETPAATTTVYRAVSNAEYQSILDTRQFTQGPNSLEGKWFSDSLEGAQLHGDALHGPGNYQIIQADVPNDAPSLFQQPNLDGRGPARYLDLQDLNGVQPKPVGGN
jgi:hypothetical protein